MGEYRHVPNRQTNQKKMYYVDGNNARRLMPAPEREYEERPEIERRKKVRKREKTAKAIQVSRGIDFLTMVFLAAVMTLTVFACFRYLELLSGNKQLDKEILANQEQYNRLVDKNNSTAMEFDKPIDFDLVYEIAVGEYGMVFPNNNQVITFDKQIHEYMRQNEIIEDEKISTLLDKIFNSK